MSVVFVLSWDMYGLESCINLTEIEHNRILNILADRPTSNKVADKTLNALILRAKFNPQRHYEIYAVEVDDSITEEDLVNMFNDSPQTSAELIRARGQKIYSDRITESEKNAVVIT